MFTNNFEGRFSMKKKKLTTKDKALLGVLAALIVIVIGIGIVLIVNNVNSANEEAAKLLSSSSQKTSSSSADSSDTKSDKSDGSKKADKSKKSSNSDSGNDNTAVTDAAESSNGSNSSSASSSGSGSGSEKKTKSDSSSSKTSSAASSNTTSKKTSSKTSSTVSVKGDKVKQVVPKENKTHKSQKTLKVNGKTCYVGDTISVVLNLTSQKSVINYQGTTSFDTKYLKLKDVKSNAIGLASASEKEINYNASTINGMNFSETGTVYTATFEVLQSGSTNIKNNLEIISELVNNNIVQLADSDYDLSIDIYS